MTLPIGMLENVTTIVAHENSVGNPCPDGRASAILARDALEYAEVIFAVHNSPEYENLEAKPGMLFLDIVPPPKRTDEFVDVGTMVLDHHVSHKDTVAAYGPLGIYSDKPGVSGALLTYTHVWTQFARQNNAWVKRDAAACEFATIAGIRDTWQKDSHLWTEACEQAEALRFYPWSFFHELTDTFGVGSGLKQLLDIGNVLISKQKIVIDALVAEAARFNSKKGTRVAVIGSTHTSDVEDAITNIDLLVGFRYFFNAKADKDDERIKLVLSFRSRGAYDVSKMAMALGGGGHKNAAGCVINGEDTDPYTMIAKIIDLSEINPE